MCRNPWPVCRPRNPNAVAIKNTVFERGLASPDQGTEAGSCQSGSAGHAAVVRLDEEVAPDVRGVVSCALRESSRVLSKSSLTIELRVIQRGGMRASREDEAQCGYRGRLGTLGWPSAVVAIL